MQVQVQEQEQGWRSHTHLPPTHAHAYTQGANERRHLEGKVAHFTRIHEVNLEEIKELSDRVTSKTKELAMLRQSALACMCVCVYGWVGG